MSDALTDVRFWAQVVGDSRRTVLCSPENESRCKGYVDARGLAAVFTVQVSSRVTDDELIVIDTPAIEAELAKPIRISWPPLFEGFPPRLFQDFPPTLPSVFRISGA